MSHRERTPDPRVVACVGLFISRCCVGRERAMTGEQILDAGHLMFDGLHVRRIGEAIRELRRQGHPIASSSSAGYWLEPDPAAYRDAIRREVLPRIRNLAADLRYADQHLCDAITGVLEGM